MQYFIRCATWRFPDLRIPPNHLFLDFPVYTVYTMHFGVPALMAGPRMQRVPNLYRGVAAAVEDLTGVKLLDGHGGRPVARPQLGFSQESEAGTRHCNSYVTLVFAMSTANEHEKNIQDVH